VETTTFDAEVMEWLIEYELYVEHRNGEAYVSHVIDIVEGVSYEDVIENSVKESVIRVMTTLVPSGPCSVEVEIYVCKAFDNLLPV
jgi:hypothetical protein